VNARHACAGNPSTTPSRSFVSRTRIPEPDAVSTQLPDSLKLDVRHAVAASTQLLPSLYLDVRHAVAASRQFPPVLKLDVRQSFTGYLPYAAGPGSRG
jgi:hypothetical protein